MLTRELFLLEESKCEHKEEVNQDTYLERMEAKEKDEWNARASTNKNQGAKNARNENTLTFIHVWRCFTFSHKDKSSAKRSFETSCPFRITLQGLGKMQSLN